MVQADKVVTKLRVKSWLGSLTPDYAEILTLGSTYCTLTINEHEISRDRGENKGTLSFISLRPCFGSFSPELVETVSKSLDSVQDLSRPPAQTLLEPPAQAGSMQALS